LAPSLSAAGVGEDEPTSARVRAAAGVCFGVDPQQLLDLLPRRPPIPHTFATPNPRPSPGHPSAGVDGLETDVCLTTDGALVLLHDPYLPLGTDLKGLEYERTATELRRARLRDRNGRLTAQARRSSMTCSPRPHATLCSSLRSRPAQTPRSPSAPSTR
jgi:hypothetical protein